MLDLVLLMHAYQSHIQLTICFLLMFTSCGCPQHRATAFTQKYANNSRDAHATCSVQGMCSNFEVVYLVTCK